jgi:hypothetical protein
MASATWRAWSAFRTKPPDPSVSLSRPGIMIAQPPEPVPYVNLSSGSCCEPKRPRSESRSVYWQAISAARSTS